jgi:hypothetical protein
MTRFMVLALALVGTALHAQQQPLAGTWKVTFPAGMRIQGGTATPLIATGILIIEVKDDSLIGNLVTDATPEIPARPPARLAAKVSAEKAVFVSRTEARVNINGQERKATAVSTWTLRATGDSLGGTVERMLEGLEMGNQGPQPVSGVRQRG